VRLFIRAVQRPDTNVYSTLAGLACRDPHGFAELEHIHVVSGDGNVDFLRKLTRTKRLSLHFGHPDTYAKIATWKPKRRGAWSYLYCLELAAKLGDDMLIMEDDVEVCNGWMSLLKQATDEAIRSFPDRRWALSAYYGFPKCPFIGSKNIVEPSTGLLFWGNLMTLWPSGMLASAHSVFRSVVGTQIDMSTDLTVQHHLAGSGAKLLFVVPGLAQHLGDITTLRPDGVRRSPIYNDRFEE